MPLQYTRFGYKMMIRSLRIRALIYPSINVVDQDLLLVQLMNVSCLLLHHLRPRLDKRVPLHLGEPQQVREHEDGPLDVARGCYPKAGAVPAPRSRWTWKGMTMPSKVCGL
jgi:hypothetical protein